VVGIHFVYLEDTGFESRLRYFLS